MGVFKSYTRKKQHQLSPGVILVWEKILLFPTVAGLNSTWVRQMQNLSWIMEYQFLVLLEQNPHGQPTFSQLNKKTQSKLAITETGDTSEGHL